MLSSETWFFFLLLLFLFFFSSSFSRLLSSLFPWLPPNPSPVPPYAGFLSGNDRPTADRRSSSSSYGLPTKQGRPPDATSAPSTEPELHQDTGHHREPPPSTERRSTSELHCPAHGSHPPSLSLSLTLTLTLPSTTSAPTAASRRSSQIRHPAPPPTAAEPHPTTTADDLSSGQTKHIPAASLNSRRRLLPGKHAELSRQPLLAAAVRATPIGHQRGRRKGEQGIGRENRGDASGEFWSGAERKKNRKKGKRGSAPLSRAEPV